VLNFDQSSVKYTLQSAENYSQQWLSHSSRVHQIRFRPGLRPEPHWGSLLRSAKLPSRLGTGIPPPNIPTTKVARSLCIRCSFGSNRPLPAQTPQLTHFPRNTEGTRINAGQRGGRVQSERHFIYRSRRDGRMSRWPEVDDRKRPVVGMSAAYCNVSDSFIVKIKHTEFWYNNPPVTLFSGKSYTLLSRVFWALTQFSCLRKVVRQKTDWTLLGIQSLGTAVDGPRQWQGATGGRRCDQRRPVVGMSAAYCSVSNKIKHATF